MTVEFFVSIVAAAFCCQNGCAGSRVTGTVILQPQTGQVVMMPATTTGVYPQQYVGGYAGAPQYAMAPQQYGGQVPQYNTQAVPPSYGQPGYPAPQGQPSAKP